MTKQFFITGLPRSRTAWFANLFTWGDSICYHDALCPDMGSVCGTDSLRRLQSKLMSIDGPRGHSCASNLIVWKTLARWFPDAKWVFISRDGCDIKDSLSKFVDIDWSAWDQMRESMAAMIKELGPMVVHFEEINITKCCEIAEYLGIDIGPATRVRQLCDMNIQIHPPILKRRIEALKCLQVVDTKEAA